MTRYLLLILSFIGYIPLLLSQTLVTKSFSPNIQTVQTYANGDQGSFPIISLDNNQYINLDFDILSVDEYNHLGYRIIHCDADWKRSSGLSDIDFLDGFNNNLIDDYSASVNTTVDYVHFSLTIPNRDVNLKLSGNYIIEIYDENNPNNVLLQTGFAVVDTKALVGIGVSSQTGIDTNKKHQQLALTINPNVSVKDPINDLKIYVRQNNRMDNQRTNLKPSMISPNKIEYKYLNDLIFEAGNEYRRFETASYRYNGMNVDHIEYNKPFYTMDIVPDDVRNGKTYSYDQGQNGKFYVRNTEGDNNNIDADYFITHFTLAMDEPINENIYINGDFTYGIFDDRYKMVYDYDSRAYHLSLLLKQGLYNYQYLTQKGNSYSTNDIEGNYYQTNNQYLVMVYYRPSGQRYDSLIGYQYISSSNKF